MTTVGDALQAARQIARQISSSPPDSFLHSKVTSLNDQISVRTHVGDIVTPLQQDALASLDQMPRQALGFARVAHELAVTAEDPVARAESALTLAIVLNRLGDFMEALPLAERAASFFAQYGEEGKAGRGLCEVAWAYTFVGDLGGAVETVARARATTSLPLLQARCDLVQARIHTGQANYQAAIDLLEKARDAFQTAQLPLEAARCERELADTHIRCDCGEALSVLERLETTFDRAGCVLDSAISGLLRAVGLTEKGSFAEALVVTTQVRGKLADGEARFFVAWCDTLLGVICRHQNRYDESLKATHQARDYYLAQGIRMEISACDINLGNIYYALNRYDDALTLYQEAAELSFADGREARTARIYTNMGLVYAKQGAFSKALYLHQRALQIAESKNLSMLAASNRADLASCYRQLGQYDEALAHLQGLKELAREHNLREALAHCNVTLAEISLARGKTADALVCLEQARSMAVEDGLDSFVALCDRLLAQASLQKSDRAAALERVKNAQTLFLRHAQTVDAALCDLTEGEMHLQWNQVEVARDCFAHARLVLSPAFPDQAWRADYGLGRCALANRDDASALEHFLRAVRTLAATRSALVAEQISDDFFARRQSVFDAALLVALRRGARETVLEVIEASKARTFLTLLQNRDWRLRRDHGDPYVAGLIEREKYLRYQLDNLRGRVAVQDVREPGDSLRGVESQAAFAVAAEEELITLSRAYEAVVTQLRLAETGLAGVAVPAPFDLESFRNAANAEFGPDWTALEYYLSDKTLTLAVVAPNSVTVKRTILSAYDHAILDGCSSPEPDLRELVYRGTLHGSSASSPRLDHLKHLYGLLIPDGLAATLIVSPHGSLNLLPFHALVAPEDGSFLIERHTLFYSPNLQALQLLLGESPKGVVSHPLALGVSTFGNQMQPLPSAAAEVECVRRAFGGRGMFLCGDGATRRQLFDLDGTGELRKFDVLHFATHAVLDGGAPHQSRVLLSDDALTTTDVIGLSLNARLVTLSACQTALGKGGSGDELIGLARSFFYAGAQALLATLWHVEDKATTEFIERFYVHLRQGENAAAALRNAQVEMVRSGRPPYHWAPFVLVGRP
ncbi:MAG: CHAT domain-containing protein [Chloroflexi bacterium]|nr:CHAT domain-containing protein [Chloroflexota bacterium]